jgi:hypothetical protein
MQFHNIWTIYFDLISGRYVPSVNPIAEDHGEVDSSIVIEMKFTLMFLLYSFFYSLIEDSADGLDAFRIWRLKYSDEINTISALEREVSPIRSDLRIFRNKIGFHGSRTQRNEEKGLELFGNHSGTKMIETMRIFKAMNAALLEKDLAQQTKSSERLQAARVDIDRVAAECPSLAAI